MARSREWGCGCATGGGEDEQDDRRGGAAMALVRRRVRMGSRALEGLCARGELADVCGRRLPGRSAGGGRH